MSVLFHQNVVVAVLASGSRGNCTYIGDGRHGVLVDCGVSTRQILDRKHALGLGDLPIDAVLVTHEHTDHVGAAAVLDRRLSGEHLLPFWMTPGTRECLHPRVKPRRIELVRPGRGFRIGRIAVEPVTVPHDTLDPVAYTVEIGSTRVAVITDLGRTTRLVEHQLSSVDVAVLEFNHDPTMLVEGSYPWQLKQRIRGPHGHLSNEQAGQLLAAGASSRLKHLLLAHLSAENNHPDKALHAAHTALRRIGRRDVAVHVARQDAPTAVEIAAPLFERSARAQRIAPRRPRTPVPSIGAGAQGLLFG